MKLSRFWHWLKIVSLGFGGLALVLAAFEQIVATNREDVINIFAAEGLANLAVYYLLVGLISHELARKAKTDA